jgi:DNA polymerase III subunit gamma/tau
MSWYRTYRPTTVSGLHLTSVREALLKMMGQGHFPHALIFAGPKGTGKTSSARIISALLNDPQNADQIESLFFKTVPAGDKKNAQKITPLVEPNADDPVVQRIYRGASYVVQEMDAASHRGIDDIRELRERVYLPPQEGKVSVYILDEVHMLTTEAFNALLKILEEPPSHVVFILATTEIHKVPETILSRCTLVQFSKATPEELCQSLRNILKQEKIEFEEAAVMAVAMAADGSFRDAVKMLESCAGGKTRFTQEDIPDQLSGVSTESLFAFVQMIVNKQEQEVIQFFEQLRTSGQDPDRFFRLLLATLHQELIKSIKGQKITINSKISHFLLTQFQATPVQHSAVIPFLGIELKALELIMKAKERNSGSSSTSSSSSGNSASPGEKKAGSTEAKSQTHSIQAASFSSDQVQNVISNSVTTQVEEKLQEVLSAPETMSYSPQDTVPTQGSDSMGDANILIQKWDSFLHTLSDKNSSIGALLRSAQLVGLEDGKVKVEVYYEFHKQQLQQPKFRAMIEESIRSVVGGNILLEFSLASKAQVGAKMSSVSGQVNEEDQLIKLAKEILV